jgi:HlyD family secretion protein
MNVRVPAFACIAMFALCACSEDVPAPVLETVEPAALVISVDATGELKSSKATPLMVPGQNWSSRRLVWMAPEGGLVKKGEVIARFSAEEGEQQLAQALIDLQRNALARSAKEGELGAGRGRVDVDLAKVGTDLGIARRYADADLSTMARNEVLDAVQDARFLGAKQDALQWKRGQFGVRGGAELAVLDAQRATYSINAKTRQDDLDALDLRAPHDGVLVLSANWTGEKPSVGSNLFAGTDFGSLPDPGAMEVELTLPQIEAQGLRADMAVELHPVGRPAQKISGKLSWVASAAKPRSRQNPVKVLTVKATVPADAIRTFGLVPGQGMQATIYLLRSKNALSVANVAIESDDGRSYVQVRNGVDFERRAVTLGVRGTARSQVLKGLRAGDEVRLASGIAPDANNGKAHAADADGIKDTPAGDSGAAKS